MCIVRPGERDPGRVKFLPSIRLVLRAARALDRIANALEGLLEVQCKVHSVQATLRLPIADAPDADDRDDTLITYSTDEDTLARQLRQRVRAREGFPRDDDHLD